MRTRCKFKFRLSTLCIAVAVVPPLLASAVVEPLLSAVVLGYLGTLAAILPAAVFLWRNSASNG